MLYKEAKVQGKANTVRLKGGFFYFNDAMGGDSEC
jgi:hypothetical protein